MKKSYKNKINKKAIFAGAVIGLAMLFPSVASASEITPENVLYLINQERVYRGLIPLRLNSDLSVAAQMKSRDMINRDYFEHYAFGLTPWDFIINQDYDYLYAGENLAMDFDTAEGMVNAWLNSPSHRANILNEDFEDTGIGVIKGEYIENGESRETVMVSNMFGRKRPAIVKVFDSIVKNVVSLFSR